MPSGAVVGLVLAAGASTRMAPERHKLIQAMGDGRPLVVVVIDAMQDAGVDPVFVVTGADSAVIRKALRDRKRMWIQNSGWEAGMGSSIAAGVRGILESGSPAGILVSVGDLPGLRAEWVASLLEVFEEAGTSECICVPMHGGRSGHPVLFGAAHFDALMALEGDRGAKSIFEANRQHLREVEIGSDAIYRDIDTPADLEAWRSS